MTEQRAKLRKVAPSRGSKPGELRGQAGKGRKPGAVNKIPAALKETILKALEAAGGVNYLARQAAEQPPAFGAARSTVAKYRHHVDQVTWLRRQVDRGNLGAIVRSPLELFHYLVSQGFKGLPVPEGGVQGSSKGPARGTRTFEQSKTILGQK